MLIDTVTTFFDFWGNHFQMRPIKCGTKILSNCKILSIPPLSLKMCLINLHHIPIDMLKYHTQNVFKRVKRIELLRDNPRPNRLEHLNQVGCVGLMEANNRETLLHPEKWNSQNTSFVDQKRSFNRKNHKSS